MERILDRADVGNTVNYIVLADDRVVFDSEACATERAMMTGSMCAFIQKTAFLLSEKCNSMRAAVL